MSKPPTYALLSDTSKPLVIQAIEQVFHKIPTNITPETTHGIVLGGDGFMLTCLQQALKSDITLYGFNFGTKGFLMNTAENIYLWKERIPQAIPAVLYPLHVTMKDWHGHQMEFFAFNEVAVLRASGQALNIKIWIDDILRMENLVGDGLILSTPMGSGAYNYAAQGPMVPLETNVLPLTPVNPLYPARWPGALLPDTSQFHFEILDPTKRPAQVSVDGLTYVDIVHIHVHMSHNHFAKVLFDAPSTLQERLIANQFPA